MTISFDTEVALAPNYPSRRHNARERKVLETVQQKLTEDLLQLTLVQAEIDFATAGNRTAADHGLGVTIPAGAVVTRVLTKVNADLSSTSSDTIQLFLGASTGGLSLSAAITADGSTIQPWTVEAVADCPGRTAATAAELTVKVDNHAITSTSGKVQYIVEYIIPA
jgi:hypothetical protein